MLFTDGESSLYHSNLDIHIQDASDLSPSLTGLLLHLVEPNR